MNEKYKAERFDQAASSLGKIENIIKKLPVQFKAEAHEIRLRSGCPIVISLPSENLFVTQSGDPAYTYRSGLLTATRENMDESFRMICSSSVHAHQHEIKNGFVTISGGHRAGICGTAVMENDKIMNIREISSINLRIAREIHGAANEVIRGIGMDGAVCGCLIAGPPGCGKTTVLRDLARQLSCGALGVLRVAVVDERGEIAATYQGLKQNDLGPCCDILDGYPKGEGIMQAIRSLSPDVVICDEIGSVEDAQAIRCSMNSGTAIIASAHAGSFEELMARPQITGLFECGAVKNIVMLKGRSTPGRIDAIYRGGDFYGAESGRADGSISCLQRLRLS